MYSIVFTGHILPLAYGVIDSENDAAWTWFFENSRKHMVRGKACASFQIGTKVSSSLYQECIQLYHILLVYGIFETTYIRNSKRVIQS